MPHPVIGQVYTLTEGEQRLAWDVARLRHANNRSTGVVDRSVGSIDPLAMDLEGFAAELAFCRMAGVEPDLSVQPRSAKRGTDQGDCIYAGVTVDVKVTTRGSGHLIVPEAKTATLFVLLTGSFPTYTLRGFAAEWQAKQPEFRRIGRKGGVEYWVPQKKLQD